MNAPYSDRAWLNPPGHPSTGTVAAYSGPSWWDQNEQSTFFEVADCHGKARLHPVQQDTPADFAAKLECLAAAALRFATHLRSCPQWGDAPKAEADAQEGGR